MMQQNAIPTSGTNVAALALALALSSCSDKGGETQASGGRGGTSSEAGSVGVAGTAGAEAGGAPAAAGGDPSGNGGATPDPLYAVMYEVFDDVGSTSYLSILDSLDIETIDVTKSREYAGGRAFLQAYNGWLFVGDPTTPNVTRYSVSEAGELQEEGKVGFGNYGLEAGSLDDWNVSFISPNKAYLFDYKEGTTIIWDPTEMEIIAEIAPPAELLREGLSLEGSPAALRGKRLFRTFNWVDYDTAEYSTEQLLGVYDVETDELVQLVKETRCPALGNLVHRDEQGTIYFSNWIWPIAGTLMHGAPRSCVLRIRAGDETFDPDWSLNYSELADGREGAMFSYLSKGQALFSVFHDERTSFDETTDPWEYAGSQNWRIWNLDLGTLAAAPLEGIDFNAGAFTPVHVDGRSFVMVPDSDWTATRLYEIAGDQVVPAIKVPGWTYQFEKVR